MTIPVFFINWDSIDLTRESIKQLRDNTDLSNITITVFDNGSTDPKNIDGLKELKRSGQIDRIFASRINLGFSLPINIGFAESKGDVFCFVSNDCFVEPDWLEEALKTLWADNRVGAVCPNIYDEKSGSDRYLIGGLTSKIHTKIAYEDIPIGQLYGAIMLFRRDAWQEVGCLDYINFSPAYSEELDWSYRATKKGYKLMCSGRSLAHHLGAVTTRKKYKRNDIHLIRLTHRIKCRLINFSGKQFVSFIKPYIRETISEVTNSTAHLLLLAMMKNAFMVPKLISERRKRFNLEKVELRYRYEIVEEDGIEYIEAL